jgi:hypothetical protein
MQTLREQMNNILKEIKIVKRDVPREDWKDIDLLESLLEEARQGLGGLLALRRILEHEAMELRRAGM